MSHMSPALASGFFPISATWKTTSLTRSPLFIVAFVCFRRQIEKILLQFMSKSVLHMFSFRSFIVSGLAFRSLIHSKFIFYMVDN